MEKRTRPYEVLIRIGATGLEVAHVSEIEEIIEGATVTFARELPPRPLALAGPEFASIVRLIDRVTLAERDKLAASHDALTCAHRDLREDHDRLHGALATQKEETATRQEALVAARAEVKEIEQQKAHLNVLVRELSDELAREKERKTGTGA